MRTIAIALLVLGFASTASAIEWKSAYSNHATGSYINFAERNAQREARGEMGDYVRKCQGFAGNLTYRFERNYCLLESPSFPAECVITTHVLCTTELLTEPVDRRSELSGLYYSAADQMYLDINEDLSFATSLNSSFRSGQRIAFEGPLRRIGEAKYYARGTITADGRCRTTVEVEIERLADGTLVVKETSPHDLNWSFGCRWRDTYATYYNLSPVTFTER